MNKKEKTENIVPLLTFITGYDVWKFAGRLVKVYDYNFLIDKLPTFDPARVNSKTIAGYFKAIQVWYRLNYGEWKAGRAKKEDGEALESLGNIFEKHFTGIGKRVIPDWVVQTRKDIRNAQFKKDYATTERLIQKLKGYGYEL